MILIGMSKIPWMNGFQNAGRKFRWVFPNNIIDETISPSLEKCTYRYHVVTSKWKDENFGSSGSSGNYERIEDDVVDGDVAQDVAKCRH